jgi:hypothetical protein
MAGCREERANSVIGYWDEREGCSRSGGTIRRTLESRLFVEDEYDEIV